MTFLLGKEMFGSFVGFVAGLLMALMPEQIYFSQQARTYPLLMLLTVIATYSLALSQKHPNSVKPQLLFLTASACGLYSHYVYLFCIVAHALYIWVISPLGKRRRRAWFLTFVGIAATIIPWALMVSVDQQRTSSDITSWAHDDLIFGSLRQRVIDNILKLVSVPEIPFGWLTAVIAYGLVLLGAVSLRSDRLNLWLLCFLVALPMAGILAMDFALGTHSVIMIRYWMIITPALCLLMACGINLMTKLSGGFVWLIAAIATLIVFGGWAAISTARGELRRRPDRHSDLAKFLQERIKDPNNEFIMTEGLNSIPLAIAYYSRGASQRQINLVSLNWATDPANKQQLRGIMLPRKDVWLAISRRSKGGSMLNNTGYQLQEAPETFGHVMVFHYRRPDSPPIPAEDR